MDFEERYLTELYARRSDTLEDVVDSIKRNGVCLKGILATPDHSSDGELKTLNMKLRWECCNAFSNPQNKASVEII